MTVRVPVGFILAAAPYLVVVGARVKAALRIDAGAEVPGLVVARPGGGEPNMAALWDTHVRAVVDAAGDAGRDAVARAAELAAAEGEAAAAARLRGVALDALGPLLAARSAEAARFGLAHAVLAGRGHVWLCDACGAAAAPGVGRAHGGGTVSGGGDGDGGGWRGAVNGGGADLVSDSAAEAARQQRVEAAVRAAEAAEARAHELRAAADASAAVAADAAVAAAAAAFAEAAARVRRSRDGWQRDADVAACTSCSRAFSIGLRRHHCRECGLVFCGGAECAPSPHAARHPRLCRGCCGRRDEAAGESARRAAAAASARQALAVAEALCADARESADASAAAAAACAAPASSAPRGDSHASDSDSHTRVMHSYACPNK